MDDESVVSTPIQICRICMTSITDRSFDMASTDFETTQSIRTKLITCIPELDLDTIPDAMVCGDCYDAINFVYEFKRKSIRSELLICKYQAQVHESNVNLAEVIQFNQRLHPKLKDESSESEDVKMESESETEAQELKTEEVDLKTENSDEDFSAEDINSDHTHTYKCLLCPYKSKQKDSFKYHMLTHSGENPFQCSQCGYQFRAKSSLKTHMRIHSGEKPYTCSQCEFRCSQRGNLKAHMLTHTGEKPYQCSLCGFHCSHKGHLKSHMLVHSEVRPFQCPQCEYQCKRSRNLKRHVLIHFRTQAN